MSPFSKSQEGLDVNLKAWSYTRLSTFESCKLRAKLAYIDKIPEPERPLPPGKTEHANDRGSRIHDAAEKYVKGGIELIQELEKFKHEFVKLREMYAEGKATTEGDWAFNREWQPVAWMSSDVWARIKCDAVVHTSPTTAVIIDYKSGRRFGNEIKHAEQMQLYVIAALIKYPDLQEVTTELWYIDQDEMASMTFTREQGLRFVANYERRGDLMTACEDFPPSPNLFSCKYCPFGPKGTGHCTKGIQ